MMNESQIELRRITSTANNPLEECPQRMLPHKQTTSAIRRWVFRSSDHKAKSFQQTRNLYQQDKNGEHGGSKDTSRGDHHLGADHGRLDSLDDQRGSYELSRPESQHQARRQWTLRGILRSRSTIRLQRNRRLQDTRTRTDEDAIRRVEGSTPVPKRTKTQNTR